MKERDNSHKYYIDEEIKQARYFKNDTNQFNCEEIRRGLEQRRRNEENARYVQRQISEAIRPTEI